MYENKGRPKIHVDLNASYVMTLTPNMGPRLCSYCYQHQTAICVGAYLLLGEFL